MTDIETCGGGGWTQVMKLDGNKVKKSNITRRDWYLVGKYNKKSHYIV
jgi:hypothetical protein